MFQLGIAELIIIALFGVGRIGKIAGEICKDVQMFRSDLSGKEEEAVGHDEVTKLRNDSSCSRFINVDNGGLIQR